MPTSHRRRHRQGAIVDIKPANRYSTSSSKRGENATAACPNDGYSQVNEVHRRSSETWSIGQSNHGSYMLPVDAADTSSYRGQDGHAGSMVASWVDDFGGRKGEAPQSDCAWKISLDSLSLVDHRTPFNKYSDVEIAQAVMYCGAQFDSAPGLESGCTWTKEELEAAVEGDEDGSNRELSTGVVHVQET
ncbi:hypothetical protein DL98DRAFT_591520 [Cadophora sp. DSE1049]|nr:hypothetical protein DL98DRAFT_591520 [Cadophora sp. DSE1049]